MTHPAEAVGTLVLLRHAKAEPHSGSDHERALAPRGRSQALEVGRQLAALGWAPQLVLVSDALRTRQTWAGVARGLGALAPDPGGVEILAELYDSSPRSALRLVATRAGEAAEAAIAGEAAEAAHTGEAGRVLVVGHEPVMSMLAGLLASRETDPATLELVRHGIPTAARCVLEVTGRWEDLGPRSARLVGVERAAEV